MLYCEYSRAFLAAKNQKFIFLTKVKNTKKCSGKNREAINASLLKSAKTNLLVAQVVESISIVKLPEVSDE